MSSDSLAREYVQCFCDGDVEAMARILSDDFHITVPIYEFHGKQAFLDRLRELNAPQAQYRILGQTASEEHASVFFHYLLGKLQLLMAMHFTIADGKLTDAILVFDTARLPKAK